MTSWISGRERMTVENISRSISMKECCWLQRGSNLQSPGLQSDAHPTEQPRLTVLKFDKQNKTRGPMVLNRTPECCVFLNEFESHYRRLSYGLLYAYWKPGSCYGALCPSSGSWTQGSVPWVNLLIMLNSVLRSKVKEWPWPLILM